MSVYMRFSRRPEDFTVGRANGITRVPSPLYASCWPDSSSASATGSMCGQMPASTFLLDHASESVITFVGRKLVVPSAELR